MFDQGRCATRLRYTPTGRTFRFYALFPTARPYAQSETVAKPSSSVPVSGHPHAPVVQLEWPFMGITRVAVFALLSLGLSDTIKITTAHHSDPENRTKTQLEQVIASYDLKKYTFTKDVVIEAGAINHAFPVLTLNVRFANSPDELLSSYIHEQLHWHLRNHGSAQQAAIETLRRLYPNAPVGGTEGAETAVSTYGHLVDCYLEILADRELMGPERTATVIADKGHYTWIYKTVLADELRIAAIVKANGLAVR